MYIYIQCTIYTVQCTSVHCILNIVQCTENVYEYYVHYL